MEEMISIVTVPGVIALVKWAKSFGITGKWSMLLAMVLGIGLNVAQYAVENPITMEGLWGAVTAGAVMGLAASGIYDTARTIATPNVELTEVVLPEPEVVGEYDIPDQQNAPIDEATYIERAEPGYEGRHEA